MDERRELIGPRSILKAGPEFWTEEIMGCRNQKCFSDAEQPIGDPGVTNGHGLESWGADLGAWDPVGLNETPPSALHPCDRLRPHPGKDRVAPCCSWGPLVAVWGTGPLFILTAV